MSIVFKSIQYLTCLVVGEMEKIYILEKLILADWHTQRRGLEVHSKRYPLSSSLIFLRDVLPSKLDVWRWTGEPNGRNVRHQVEYK